MGHLALEKGLSAHSQQGPDIGTAYLVGLLLVLVALGIGTILVKIRYDKKRIKNNGKLILQMRYY